MVSTLCEYRKPPITPLPLGLAVKHYSSYIDDAIDRGIDRLLTTIKKQPDCHDWIEFGWFDGGLDSKSVGMSLGFLRINEDNIIQYGINTATNTVTAVVEVPLNNNWDRVRHLFKCSLIMGYPDTYLKDKNQIHHIDINVSNKL